MTTLGNFIPPVAFHPGVTLSEKLSEMGMDAAEFARLISLPEQTVRSVIDGAIPVTSDLAVAFEGGTGIPAHFWLNKQRVYDGQATRPRAQEGRIASTYASRLS